MIQIVMFTTYFVQGEEEAKSESSSPQRSPSRTYVGFRSIFKFTVLSTGVCLTFLDSNITSAGLQKERFSSFNSKLKCEAHLAFGVYSTLKVVWGVTISNRLILGHKFQ
jgi:hypothetical protein